MATRGQNLEAEAATEEVDWRMRTGKDIEQVQRLRPREEDEESPLCLGLNNNGERCQRVRRTPFCSDHLWQWNALSDETKFAINDLAELPQNAFNHELWDTQHEKLHTFITDLCTEQAADAVQSAALAWNADQKQASVRKKEALVSCNEALVGAFLVHARLTSPHPLMLFHTTGVYHEEQQRQGETLPLRSVLTGTAVLSLESPSPVAPGSSGRLRSRSHSREPSWRSRNNDTEVLRAEVAALKKVVKAFAELMQTNSEESRDKVIALCAALT